MTTSSSYLTLSILAEDIAETTNDEMVLLEMSTDPKVFIRTCAAKNVHTPASTLDRLSSDSKRPVLKAVMKNPNAPIRARVRAFIRCYG